MTSVLKNLTYYFINNILNLNLDFHLKCKDGIVDEWEVMTNQFSCKITKL